MKCSGWYQDLKTTLVLTPEAPLMCHTLRCHTHFLKSTQITWNKNNYYFSVFFGIEFVLLFGDWFDLNLYSSSVTFSMWVGNIISGWCWTCTLSWWLVWLELVLFFRDCVIGLTCTCTLLQWLLWLGTCTLHNFLNLYLYLYLFVPVLWKSDEKRTWMVKANVVLGSCSHPEHFMFFDLRL